MSSLSFPLVFEIGAVRKQALAVTFTSNVHIMGGYSFKCQNRGCTFIARAAAGRSIHERSCKFKRLQKRRRLASQSGRIPNESDVESYESQGDLEFLTWESYQLDQGRLLQTSLRINEKVSVAPATTGIDPNSRLAVLLSEIAHNSSNKIVNSLILSLADPDIHIPRFLESFPNANECHSYTDSFCRQALNNNGFVEKHLKVPDTGVSCTIFTCNPVELLRQQIEVCNAENCHFEPYSELRNGNNAPSHVMASEFGKELNRMAKFHVQLSDEETVFWKSLVANGSESFAGLLQIYSDKTSTTLKSRGFKFYPVHLVLLNFKETLRRKLITSGRTIVGYLPTDFVSENGMRLGGSKPSKSVRRDTILSTHHALREMLSPLTEVAKEGFLCVDEIGIKRNCHAVLTTYCSDIPEAKDMTGVLSGKTAKTCFRCLAPTDQMSGTTSAEKRNSEDTLKMIEESKNQRDADGNGGRNENETRGNEFQTLKENSLSGFTPALHHFPFMGIIRDLDVFQIHSFESLHNFYLGISKLLKVACSDRLRDETLQTFVLRLKNGQARTFGSVRSLILSGVNHILRGIQEDSPMPNLRVDYSVSTKSWRYNGIFLEDGLVGLLQAKDFQSLDMVFPIVGGFIDRCCGEVSDCPNTRVFTKYSDVLNFVFRRRLKLGWVEEELEELDEMIRDFKSTAVEVFGPYQKSNMGTLKFHLLDHLVEDLGRFPNIEVLNAGIYEYSHCIVKRMYNHTSRRKNSAMSESVRMLERSEAYRRISGLEKSTGRKRLESRDAVLVRDGRRFSIEDLTISRRKARKRRQKQTICDSSGTECGDEIVADVGEEGSRVLIRLLRRETEALSVQHSDSKKVLLRVKSGYVKGGFVPSLKHFNETRRDVLLEEPVRPQEQRIIACRNFAGGSGLHQDCVLIDSSTDPQRQTAWIAKVLSLFRVKHTSGYSEQEKCYAFVQYFEAIAAVDEIDRTLNCIRLQWARACDDNGLHPTKWFDLLPVEVIRGVIHVVSTDYEVRDISGEYHWTDQTFYINRFHFDSYSLEV